MPRGRRKSGESTVSLAQTLDRSRTRIQLLRAELESESRNAATALARIQQLVGNLDGAAIAPAMSGRAGARRGKPVRRAGGQRDKIISFLKGKSDPQAAEAIALHVGNRVANVRQALMHMVKSGTLVSLKKDGDSFRKPGKGERGGLYGVK